jgi:tripartite-type tricarboxylate transporter receptor subunit TctC
MISSLGKTCLVLAALSACLVPARAQEPVSFRGKSVTLIAGSTVGGGYDTFTRLIAAHMARHLPGQPTMVVQNMPGAGSLLLANHLANLAPKDGTVLGAVNPQIVTEPLVRPERVKYDPTRMSWIGSALRETHVAIAWHTAPVSRFEELFKTELLLSGTGGATDTFPTFLNGLLGTRFKVISGYPGTREGLLAMERGEVQGNGGITWASLKATQAQWLREGKVKVILQYGLSKHPELPQTDWIYDWAKTPEQRAAMNMVFARQEFGRPYVGPPGLSPAIVAVLRQAFDATMADAEFLADAQRRAIDIEPITGAEIQALVADIFKTPPAVVARVKEIIGDKD